MKPRIARRTWLAAALAAGLLTGVFGCADTRHAAAPSLHELQLLGSHNSYKRALPAPLLRYLQTHDPDRARAIDYSHHSLASQLDGGLRQLEIDVLLDAEGGRYASPFAERYLGERGHSIGTDDGFDRNALLEPGLKVLHIPDIDIFSHCAAFLDCLMQIRDWSDRNPAHLPIFVLINVKETAAPLPGAVQPAVFASADYDRIDAEILSVWPRRRLVTPSDVIRPHMTLRESVVNHGWPAVDASRGKLIFIFDGNARQADEYRHGHPSLEGRIMFAAVEESLPEAAIMVVNEPVRDRQRIRSLVDRGFIVRTRADADLDESPAEMRRRYEAAVASGAQIISTDFYAGSPNAERTGYSIQP